MGNIETVLARPGLSGAERREALTRLARLQELSGDIEAAARSWGEAAAAEPGRPDDISLIRGAWCLAAMGEWDRAGAAVRTVLLAGRPGPALIKARYLGALIEALGSADFSALQTLAGSPDFQALRPAIYYALWKVQGPPAGTAWKNRLLTEFPRSPEGRIAVADGPAGGVSAAPTPLWLLFPGPGAPAASSPPAASAQTPAPDAATAVPASAASGVLLQTGLFGNEENADRQADRLRTAGFSPRIVRRRVNGAEYWAVGVPPGQNMNQTIQRIKDAGFESFPVTVD
jgi:cell division septation protein DedD